MTLLCLSRIARNLQYCCAAFSGHMDSPSTFIPRFGIQRGRGLGISGQCDRLRGRGTFCDGRCNDPDALKPLCNVTDRPKAGSRLPGVSFPSRPLKTGSKMLSRCPSFVDCSVIFFVCFCVLTRLLPIGFIPLPMSLPLCPSSMSVFPALFWSCRSSSGCGKDHRTVTFVRSRWKRSGTAQD